MARHTLALLLVLTIGPNSLQSNGTTPADSPFQVFVEPFGDNTGFDLAFADAVANDARLGDGVTRTFDDLTVWPQNYVVSSVTAGSCEVAMFGNTNKGAPFVFHPNGFYHWEGQMFEGTLVMGSVARFVPLQGGGMLGAVGFWIFDDGNLKDSIYQVDVVDANGNTTTEYVANGVPRVGGYEVEGFFGVISQCGITSLTVTSLNAETGEAWNDPFEIDYLTVASLETPVTRPQDPPADDGGTCTCSCRHCRHCDGDRDQDGDGGGCGRGRGHDRGRGRGHDEDRGHNGGSSGDHRNDNGRGRNR
ncbi:MAG: hypothetical protein H6819_02710 [Phycisphaerales bacterium]|nr:hypothetical protein [Phycisphaerales bacterium]MCB9856876.1 hypothetical protein [Phycisphaerales bacterium]MCB9861997.1 hypothetical protein [Phycisphaerales bacterium]